MKNSLGTAGLARFLTDASITRSDPEMAESVFNALHQSCYGVTAYTQSQELVDKHSLDPTALWNKLNSYYDISLNRANVVLFEIKRLLS